MLGKAFRNAAIATITFFSIGSPMQAIGAETPESQLFLAVQFQDVPKINALISKGANVNHLENGRPLLGWAAQNGNVEVVQALLNGKANVNVADEGIVHTPLMRAIETHQTKVVEVLLKAKANPNAKTPEGETCLDMAVASRKPEIVSAVVTAGADVKHVNAEGDSPALRAAQDGMPESVEIIKILGKAKANLDASNIVYTPLIYAVQQGNKEIVKALLDAGANPNAKNQMGKAPLHFATDNKEIVELLIAAKADPNIADDGGSLPLIAAIENGTTDAVAALIKGGADVNKADSNGSLPIDVATNYQKTDIVELLQRAGAKKT